MPHRSLSVRRLFAFCGACALAVLATCVPAQAAPAYLRLLVEPQAGYGPIDALVSSARSTVDVEMYELADPTIESILAADEHRGVRVNVILDSHYVKDLNAPAFSYLRAHGVAVEWAPARFDVDHEKMILVDNSTAVVMTGNLTSRYYAGTRDCAVIDTDPTDVAVIAATFDADWLNRPTPIATGTDLVWSPGSENMIVWLIGTARHELLVENEEMDDSYVTSALVAAAHRGVRVEIAMTADSSWDSAFATLVAAGAEVRTYPDNPADLYIHAKAIVVDPGSADERAFVGSENFSVASLVYNRELGLITSAPAVVLGLAHVVEADVAGGTAWSPAK